ncbi:hypothetical protein ACFQ6N_39210 [Kitasatospora sp. NPDC056446]|uniref:hypothetical protein n=1 Tax=Kitasatospora sp. NPDC056446 TaxID=3345819 RepID=UPI003688D58F
MKVVFMVAFITATAVEVCAAALLLWQAVRRHGTAWGTPVPRGRNVLSSASIFGGTMTIVTLAAHGWSSLNSNNLLLYAATFGFATAALIERVRNRPASRLLYLAPALLGALAGLVGNEL